MTITKLDLTHHLSDTLGLTAKESKALVNTLFDTIRTTLAAGEDVKLSGFGNFTLREKRARSGRNPKNGDLFEIRARRVVTFRASPAVKEMCNKVKVLPAFGKARALAGVDNGQILSP
ncbi:integration host factor subunit alpha [Acidithiobacillus sp.]|jgi:integration host factor subunit alpha|uniref:integration host factor subunit alpha n=1 Tax=Acidithiobacillus sp. TaxID=1872118 RepID=UPI001CDB715B|nr:integration host factor subunit alpha [Acidithiobacillus sp.]MDA8246933.1 integration host factor subunit alpha [Acidithiobacillus sp.]UBU63714.1 integration host factor subunit alpha [Acidithiobacillus ferrooxidans]